MRKADTWNKKWEQEEAARGMVQLLKGRERSVSRWEWKLSNVQM